MDSLDDEPSSEVPEQSVDGPSEIVNDAAITGERIDDDQSESHDRPAGETEDSSERSAPTDGSGEAPDEGTDPGPDRVQVEGGDDHVESDPEERIREEDPGNGGQGTYSAFEPIHHAYGSF